MNSSRRLGRRPLGLAALLVIAGVLASSPLLAHLELHAYLDLDNDATTGCTVETPDGPFEGVERVAISEVITNIAPVVEHIDLVDCEDNHVEIEVQKGGFPLGVGTAPSGFDGIETFVPLAGLPTGTVARIGVAMIYEDEEIADGLISTGSAPILVGITGGVTTIPTLGTMSLVLLAIALAVVSLSLLRRRSRGSKVSAIAVAIFAAGFGIASATIESDGDLSGWSSFSPLATDDAADAAEGVNLFRLFATVSDGVLYLRVDADLAYEPGVFSSGHQFFDVGGPAVEVDSDLTVSDFDDTHLLGATVVQVNRLDGASETLAFSTAGTAISGAYDSGMGVITFTGFDTVAHYQQVLRTVTYFNALANPDLTERSIEFRVRDDIHISLPNESSVRLRVP